MWISRLINKIFKNNIRGNPLTHTLSPEGRDEGKKRGEANEREKQILLKQLDSRLLKLEGSLDKAINGYRLMLINNNPDILPELITGETIETLDASLIKAKELTGKIKLQLDEKKTAERIPEGAPTRLPPNTDSLSSEEKIRYGLQNSNHK
jgi:hypothetical protein